MSRDYWFDKKKERTDWENLIKKEKFSLKTSDPEAKNYDEATEMFLKGVRLARRGDLAAAAPLISCAYLLDGRSVNFARGLPPNTPPEKKDLILDYELLGALSQHNMNSISTGVLTMMLAQYLGSDPGHGQMIIGAAMSGIESLLQYIEDNPFVEDPKRAILGGCLTRTNLLRQRSSFHMAMGNRKKAMKDLTKALKIDENYTAGREARACVWAAAQLKDSKTIHAEFKRVVSEVHEDNRGLEVAYAWLAITTLDDPSLGNVEDAKRYFESSLKATIRRDEIYGKRQREQLPPVLEQAHLRFQRSVGGPEFHRDLLDMINSFRNTVSTEEGNSKHGQNKYSCVTCGAIAGKNTEKLLKCGRCKVVSYCSKEC